MSKIIKMLYNNMTLLYNNMTPLINIINYRAPPPVRATAVVAARWRATLLRPETSNPILLLLKKAKN